MTDDRLLRFAEAACQSADSTGRMAQIMRRASDQPLRIAALGGSVTYGYNETGAVIPYPELLCRLLPFQTVLRNFAISGTDSYLGLLLTARDMPQFAPDLVILEYAVNQGVTREMVSVYEGLIYRLLTLPSAPAVITVMCVNRLGYTSENCLAHVARHYGLPVISVRDGLKTFAWDEYSSDDIHPNEDGQAMLAQAICTAMMKSEPKRSFEIPDAPCLDRDASALRLCDLHAGNGGFFSPVPFLTAFGASDAVILQSGSDTYTLRVKGDTVILFFRQSSDPDTADALLTVDDCAAIRLQAACLSGWGNPAAVRIIPQNHLTTHTLRFQRDGKKGRFVLWAVAAF